MSTLNIIRVILLTRAVTRIVRFGLVVGFSERFIPKGSYLPTVLSGRSLFDSKSNILELIRDSDDMLESTCYSINENPFTLEFLEPVVSKDQCSFFFIDGTIKCFVIL